MVGFRLGRGSLGQRVLTRRGPRLRSADAILNVDFSGPETCAVTVRCPVAPNFWWVWVARGPSLARRSELPTFKRALETFQSREPRDLSKSRSETPFLVPRRLLFVYLTTSLNRTDILILCKTNAGWQVVSKTYKTEDSADPSTIHDPDASDLMSIASLLKTYFDGLYEGDTKKLGAVFHECSYLRSLDDKGNVTNLARDDWFKAVEGRDAPSKTGLERADKILSVTQIGPDCAIAKVKCQIVPRYFTDFLTMIKDGAGWRIVSKVGFHSGLYSHTGLV